MVIHTTQQQLTAARYIVVVYLVIDTLSLSFSLSAGLVDLSKRALAKWARV